MPLDIDQINKTLYDHFDSLPPKKVARPGQTWLIAMDDKALLKPYKIINILDGIAALQEPGSDDINYYIFCRLDFQREVK